MRFVGVSDELNKKAEACKNSKELLDLAKAEGVALSDQQLESVAGGLYDPTWGKKATCPTCAHELAFAILDNPQKWVCSNCGGRFDKSEVIWVDPSQEA